MGLGPCFKALNGAKPAFSDAELADFLKASESAGEKGAALAALEQARAEQVQIDDLVRDALGRPREVQAEEVAAAIEALPEVEAARQQTYEQYLDTHPNKKAVLARDKNAVHNEIMAQLESTGRFRRQVIAAYAVPLREFYAQNAKRMGLRPTQLLERLPLKFVAKSLGLGDAFAQPEQAATFGDFAPGKVRDILTKHNWAVFTATNPNNVTLSDEENAARMESLYAYLDGQGITYQKVMGRYGDDTQEMPSVIGLNLTARQALDIGRMFDQQSVLTRDGLIYQNGDVNPSTGDVEDYTAKGVPENNYTRIPDGAVFYVDIDFGTVLKQGEHRDLFGGFADANTTITEIQVVSSTGETAEITRGNVTSDGRVIAPTVQALKNFWTWFGDSVLVDDQGRPIVAYHGTKTAPVEFAPSHTGGGSTIFGNYEVERYGIFVSTDKALSESYALQGASKAGATMMPLFVRIENPLDMLNGAYTDPLFKRIEEWAYKQGLDGYRVARNFGDFWGGDTWGVFDQDGGNEPDFWIRMLKDLGYDGVKMYEPPAGEDGISGETWVAFDSTQIKSAIGNLGTFDPQNPNVLYQDDPGKVLTALYHELLKKVGDDIFTHPRSNSMTLEGVADDVSEGRIKSRDVSFYNNDGRAMDALSIPVFVDGVKTERDAFVTDDGEDLWINIAASEEGIGGSMVYAIVGNYAFNTGKVFIGDPYGITNAGMVRRLQNMLSLATKFGTTEFMKPHPKMLTQFKQYGLDWKVGDDQFNLQHMLQAVYNLTKSYAPEIADVTLNFESGEFEKNGKPVEDGYFEGLATESHATGRTGAPGSRTLKISAAIGTLIGMDRSQVDKIRMASPESLRADRSLKGVLYQTGGKLGEVSIVGEHFSSEQRPILNGSYYGRGVRGAERGRVMAAQDARLRQRLHFYVDEGKGVFPEGGVGNFKHTVRLDNMYDAARNPQRFPVTDANGNTDMNVFESAVLDAGFSGYYIEEGFTRQGVAVLLGEKSIGVQPEAVGKFYQTPHGWYYSQLARMFEGAKAESQPAAQWKGWLTANAAKFGVKKDEIQWTGITDWLDLQEGRVSKQQIADYLNTNGVRAKVAEGLPLFQPQLGSFDPNRLTISLLDGANLSTVLHESGHFYLRALELMSAMPEATQEMKDDFDKVMAWFGTTREQWAAMGLEQQRPFHEQWAESQERWMLEGKSPTLEMQPVFARFRAWLLNVYKSVEQFLLTHPKAGKLNDEIRGVFSRLIASEEAIAQAEQARGYALLFASEEEAVAQGISSAEYREYVKQSADAHTDSVEDLQQRSLRDMKWLSNARSKAVRDLQKQAAGLRKEIRAQVTAEVLSEPINQARNFLKTGEMTDPNTGEQIKAEKGFKLDKAALAEMYPETALGNPGLTKLRGLTGAEGLHPDLVAQMFGFPSGDALVRELIDGENAQDKIKGLTDQRMLEQHGELIDQRSIEAAADAAVHNEARARFMATGLKMLTKSPISSYQLSRAAKEAAENAIARKKVANIRPSQYTAAETRANKAVLAALAKDPQKAAEAQREALLNNRMASAAIEAQAEVAKMLKYVGKFRKEGTRKALSLTYLEQIDEMLAAFDADPKTTLKSIQARQDLTAWVAEQEAMGFEPILDPAQMEALKRTSYKEMTLEELRGFIDGIKEIEHYGRQEKKLLTALDKRAFAERMVEAEASIRENANRTVSERGTPADVVGKVARFGRWFAANHRKFASFLREMDGSEDNGVMWNLLGRPMNDAGGREVAMREAANEAVSKLFEPIRKAISDSILPGNLYARKTVVPGTRLSMTLEERIMFVMNTGNEGNLQRLMDGGITGVKAVSQADVQAVVNSLSKEQLDFVQGVWDYFETFRPAIEAMERELTGKTPQWVEPLPLNTPHGTYRGGYFPAKYDALLSTRSEALEAATDLRLGMKGAFGAAATRNGYTKARAAAVVNRPLLLSFNAISQHVTEVTHRLAWQPWMIDANRSLRRLDGVIREHYGAEVLGELRKTVIAIAQGDAPASGPLEVAINRVRTGSTIVGLGWRVATALLQPAGLAQSWSRVGGRWIARGLSQYLAHPFETTAWVREQSKFMAGRSVTVNREVNEILNTIRAGEKLSALEASYFSLIGRMQTTVDIPTWLGAREKSLEAQGYEDASSPEERAKMEATAAAVADQAVIDSQSDGAIQNLAGIQRGSPAQKLWSNFYSYFSATYNLNVEAYRRTDFKSLSEIGLFAGDMVLLNIVPVLFSAALAQLTKGKCDWDDSECLVNAYAHQQLGYLFGQMLLLREIGSAIDVATGGAAYGYSGPAGQRFFADLYKLGQQAAQGDADMAAFKAANSVAGMLLHYPAGQVNNVVEGIIAAENGDVEGLAIAPAILFGPPR